MSNLPDLNRLFGDLKKLSPVGYAVGLHIRYAAPLITAHSYPTEWLETYALNAYALRDPMISWGLSTVGTCRWSTMGIPDPFGIMKQAGEFGLKFGAGISCGPIHSRTIVGISRSDREYTDGEIAAARAIVHKMHEVAEPPTELTKAQVEALRCIAEGDRHTAAAAKLGISESALKARLVTARDRLLARTIPEAIQRAKEYRLL